jgi:hypothetical protein
MKKGLKLIVVPLIALMAFSTKAETHYQEVCKVDNSSFKAGEKVTYTVYYAVAGIYVNAGTATFTNTLETLNNKPVYHIVGEGNTNASYDWIYKVRDKYETYIDTATMQTLKFVRNVNEGGSIGFSMFLDNEVFNMYIRYLGKETIKTKYGKFNAIKFKPLLIKGTIFEGGEQMTVWVTDDANHIPVRIETLFQFAAGCSIHAQGRVRRKGYNCFRPLL